jgi:predicted ATP-dependent endonuclease of OLD family
MEAEVMRTVDLKIHNVRNITDANMSFPFEKGLYAIVGENGCGKSTIMLSLSLMVKTSSAHWFREQDIVSDSSIDISFQGREDHWFVKNSKLTTDRFTFVRPHNGVPGHSALVVSTHVEGFYEGSIFYGCRFDDFSSITDVMKRPELLQNLVEADEYVSSTLGYILHNDTGHYPSLMKIRNRACASSFGFVGMPYFYKVNGGIISQFQMSSGECMLLSLLDFINNLIIKSKNKKSSDLLFLIDEVELALHPGAIDRLVMVLDDLVKKSSKNLIIYFSTHSAELIHRISAKNIFLIENDMGQITGTRPCYPNYAVRSLYIPNGFDFLILVEDELAKALVDKTIRDNQLSTSKLCCVLPAGGWSQMLKLHHDIETYNVIGFGKRVISIYDGDARQDVQKKEEYSSYVKAFLPIPSIEKYLVKKCIIEADNTFIKRIGDKYFTQRSLKDIIFDYKNDPRTKKKPDKDGKAFYDVVCSNLLKNGIEEKDFIKYLCDDISEIEVSEMQQFTQTLSRILNRE